MALTVVVIGLLVVVALLTVPVYLSTASKPSNGALEVCVATAKSRADAELSTLEAELVLRDLVAERRSYPYQ